MTSTNALEERVAELESRFALQDEAVRDLSDMVAAQWTRIDALLGMVEELKERLAASRDNPEDPTEEPPPPHY